MIKLVLLITLMVISLTVFSQNLGIGLETALRARFELNGAVGRTSAIFGNIQGISVQRDLPALGFNQYHDGTNKRYLSAGYAGLQWYDASTGFMYFESSPNGAANAVLGTPTRLLSISPQGNVGIGMDPDAFYKLVVARGTGNDGTAVFRGSQYSSHFNYSTAENLYIRGGKDNAMVQINNGGAYTIIGSSSNLVRVGINSGNPVYALEMRQVNGRGLVLVSREFDNWHINVAPNSAQGSYQRLYFNEAANPIGSYHPQTGQYSPLSDKRAKRDVEPLEQVSAKLMQLKPVSYYMKDNPGAARNLGFLAQEVQAIFPELVLKDPEPSPGTGLSETYAVNYGGFAVYVIKTMQEQQETIDDLKSRIEKIKVILNLTEQPVK